MGGKLTQAQAKARAATSAMLADFAPAQSPLFLVACSGGADSLALAATAAFLQRKYPWRFGAVVIDHQLQEATAEASRKTVEQLQQLGLEPVFHRAIDVHHTGEGIEAAAREARYRVFDELIAETKAAAILLGHTRDDQAEQVLLGLARGSGTRSLAGIPPQRSGYLRPLLDLTRAETEEICRKEGLLWWEDPTNADPRFTRNRIRHHLMPELREHLGATIEDNLARTAQLCRQDADYLDELARERFDAVARHLSETELGTTGVEERYEDPGIELDSTGLTEAPAALQGRIIALAIEEVGGESPSFERIAAVQNLLSGSRSPGPIQLGGHIHVWRGQRQPAEQGQNPAKYGKLVFVRVRS